MSRNSDWSRLRDRRTGRSSAAHVRRDFKPVVQPLEGRELLASVVAVAATAQYGIPSVFAVDSAGNVSYDYLTSSNGIIGFSGWAQVPGAVNAKTISTGTVLTAGAQRPDLFMINSADNIYYTSINSSGGFNALSTVGINVGAVSISTGTLPITNAPYVVMINTAHDVWYTYQLSNGTWAGWSPVGVGVGGAFGRDRSRPGVVVADSV